VCCHELQYVASYWLLTMWALDARECCHMCRSVLQCVAVCCQELQHVASYWLMTIGAGIGALDALECCHMCCSVLQCVATSCSVLLATGC